MNQNFIKIIYVNQSKKIEKKPISINEFKEKVSNLFNINHNDLKNFIIKMKNPIEVFLENNEIYNDMVLYSNLKNIVIEIIDLNNPIKKEDYSCVFFEDNEILNIKLEDLKKNDNRIKYIFKIQNNGEKPWPEDTFLKCVKEDSDIFFFHCNNIYYNEVYNEFEIIINFKNSYPNIGDYQCHAILMSDRKGQMGKNVGTLNIKIY